MNQPQTTRRYTGFTLLEVLIVIGIIGVLVTMLAIGTRAIRNNMKARSTQTALENVAGMQAEYENSAGKLKSGVGGYGVYAFDQVITPIPDKYAALIITPSMMDILCRVPKNKSAVASFSSASAGEALTVKWYDSYDYRVGDSVTPDGNANIFVCKTAHTSSPADKPTTPLGAPASTYWNWAKPVMVRDAWDMPIAFVGTAGLDLVKPWAAIQNSVREGVITVDSGKTRAFKCVAVPPSPAAQPSGPNQYWNEVSTTGSFIRKSPDGRPFWVSAGPDGDFATDDDNLYSFEN
ncbi:MAG: type II secretion system protein [Burkholderiales bacterium]|nr:type II secretion system protein [Phycisphaerae bacterium]